MPFRFCIQYFGFMAVPARTLPDGAEAGFDKLTTPPPDPILPR